jgi:hypothetical protein
MKKVCSQCGGAFECGHGAPGCWCERITLSRTALEQIAGRATDCLCPRCLAEYADRELA